MEKLLKIATTIDKINEAIGKIAYWFVLLMVIIGVWNVIGRYLGRWLQIKLTSNAFLDLQSYLFALVFLLGAAYSLKHNEHVRVDLFYKDLNRQQKALANFIGTILFLIPFSIIVIYFSWNPVINSWINGEISPNADGLPLYPIKSFLIISFLLLMLQGISEAIKNWAIFTENLPRSGGDR
ncbi:MAG: TRAP transporter small permease subunit [Prochloraceae cyanobacterium]